jgi:hypothetical protein
MLPIHSDESKRQSDLEALPSYSSATSGMGEQLTGGAPGQGRSAGRGRDAGYPAPPAQIPASGRWRGRDRGIGPTCSRTQSIRAREKAGRHRENGALVGTRFGGTRSGAAQTPACAGWKNSALNLGRTEPRFAPVGAAFRERVDRRALLSGYGTAVKSGLNRLCVSTAVAGRFKPVP